MFVGANSVCYLVCAHEAKDVDNSCTIPSLWTYKQDRGITLGRSSHSGLYILLILAGDVSGIQYGGMNPVSPHLKNHVSLYRKITSF